MRTFSVSESDSRTALPTEKSFDSLGAEDVLSVTGRFVEDGSAYRIDGVERMAPFLMSVVSASDHWLYLSSQGGLTAGRVEAARSLLAYETDDKLHLGHGVKGPMTIVRAFAASGESVLWEPFDDRAVGSGRRRSIIKSALGTRVTLEERDIALGLTVRVEWTTSERFGFVRTVELCRESTSNVVRADVLDGLLDVTPAEVPLAAQQTLSNLVDAYKRTELDPATALAIYSMEALLSDRAAPAEALRANVVWSTGTRGAKVLLSDEHARAFREGRSLEHSSLSVGRRGAYLVLRHVDFTSEPVQRWRVIGDVHLSQVEVIALRELLRSDAALDVAIDHDVAAGEAALTRNVAAADGLQCTEDRSATAHHFANVLFNNMRGGVFDRDHRIDEEDLARFLTSRNREVAARHNGWLRGVTDINHTELVAAAYSTGDPHLVRLCLEYLPLTFARRHGDPSRPWNRFSIRLRNPDGSRSFNYEGNWRDIFQNWEALCQSFPGFFEPVIARFVNASTVDGFNPYRITREGIDWEVPDPHDPWGHFGYWGDHQLVYLVRLLEASERMRPGAFAGLLDRDVYSYADVPYRLRSYDELIRDAKTTLVFDRDVERRTAERVARIGADGRYVAAKDGAVLLVNLAEKLLVPALSKLSCMVVDGGIWLNTQRPEWNDANNALVGSGLSVVTLAHLRRYLSFLAGVFQGEKSFAVSAEVSAWLHRVTEALVRHAGSLAAPRVDDRARRAVMDDLGRAFSDYRAEVYTHGLTERVSVAEREIRGLCSIALTYVDHGLRANIRDDGLCHSYNLLALEDDVARVSPLYEMLEGQVALLSAGLLRPDEGLRVVRALFASAMYRADQRSFMLYPERRLPSFFEKNQVPESVVRESPLLSALLAEGDASIVARDVTGVVRFQPDLHSASDLAAALDELAHDSRFALHVQADKGAALRAYEAVFHHHAFTGRSGTMHKYEGIGCIYWHMVAKLLVAAQEMLFQAIREGASSAVVSGWVDAYESIRAGLGYHKSPSEYGAFPTDPYSHTPRHLGAQQPGMTGQVKEEILTRLWELGVRFENGLLRFDATLLRRGELLQQRRAWTIPDGDAGVRTIDLPADSVGFTVCRVPVILHAQDGPWRITVTWFGGKTVDLPTDHLDASITRVLLARTGGIDRIDVAVPRSEISRN
ncbi:MAG: hypothetical protein IPK82_29535 [Polyangiaceae bacterium]|nr:hypothetical protein [Polyangiaceae bacterium]